MKLKTIREVKKLKGKKVLLRVEFNVPLEKREKSWVVADDRRMVETLPTIKYLIKNKCKIVLMTYVGRPNGKVVDKLKTDPIAGHLSKLLKQPVKKVDDCVGPKVLKSIQKLKDGKILMLENVRFYPEEMNENRMFSALLVQGYELIVFDAFGQMHRVHSSTTGITKLLPSYAGFLMEKEIKALSKVIKKPRRPLVVVLGGAKVSDKLYVLKSLVKIADKVLIGGGVANAFLKASRVKVGRSFIEDVFVDKAKRKQISSVTEARKILKRYKSKIVLPVDLIAGNKIDRHALVEVVDLENKDQINKRWKFLDIGPKTIKNYLAEIKQAKTIFFNGPMGVFEIDKFETGTKKIAQAVANAKAQTIVGGGDTEIVAEKYKLGKKFTHLSTGGGASMAFLAGQDLPVLKRLTK